MKSVIQKNLGGPLSDVFFSCLTPIQKDNIGYTPSLKGPGRDLWVSPSDILIGRNRLTVRTEKALTHKTILELGLEIENRFHKTYELKLQESLEKKELEMHQQQDALIEKALQEDREGQCAMYCKVMEQSTTDTVKAYQVTTNLRVYKEFFYILYSVMPNFINFYIKGKESWMLTLSSHFQRSP